MQPLMSRDPDLKFIYMYIQFSGLYFTAFYVYLMVSAWKLYYWSQWRKQVAFFTFFFLFHLFCRALAVLWLPPSYLFCHLMMLMFGIWVVIQPSSHDANQVVIIYKHECYKTLRSLLTTNIILIGCIIMMIRLLWGLSKQGNCLWES